MRRRFLWFCCKHRSLKDISGHFLKILRTRRPQHRCHYQRLWPWKRLLMFPWIVAVQQECIIVLKAAAFVSFRGEPCTYKLYQNVLQTLLRVRVAPLLKATGESGESGFLTVCALDHGAHSSGEYSSRGVEILLAASCYRNRDKLWTLRARRLQGFTIFFLRGGGGIVIFLSEKEREEEEEDALEEKT